MKTILYMAISIDGCITRGEDDSNWVSESDWDQFYSYISLSDVIVMGRNTMDQFGEDEFPIEGPLNIVLSRNQSLHTTEANLIITEGSPQEMLDLVKGKGLSNVLIIGGENTNGQFLKAGLIDEIVLSVHPLVIGGGKSLFGREEINCELELLGSKVINDELVQLRYRVVKKV